MMESVIKADMKRNEGSLMPTDPVFMQIYDSSSKANEKVVELDSEADDKSKLPEQVKITSEAVKVIENETILDVLEKEEETENIEDEKGGEGVLKRKLSEVCHYEDCTFFGKPNPHVFLAKCQENVEEEDITDNGNVQCTIDKKKILGNLEPPNKKIKIYRGVEVKVGFKESNGDDKVDNNICLKVNNDNENEDLENNKHSKVNNIKIVDKDDTDVGDDKKELSDGNDASKVLKESVKKREMEGLPDDEDNDDELLYDGDEEEDEEFDDDNDNILDSHTEIKSSKACNDVVQISSGESGEEDEEEEDDDSREDDDDEEDEDDLFQKKFTLMAGPQKIQHGDSKPSTPSIMSDKKTDTPHPPVYHNPLSNHSLTNHSLSNHPLPIHPLSNHPLTNHPLSNHPLSNHPSLYQHHTEVQALPPNHLTDQRSLPSNPPKPNHHNIPPNHHSINHHLTDHHHQGTAILDSHHHYEGRSFECGMVMLEAGEVRAGKALVTVVTIEHLVITISTHSQSGILGLPPGYPTTTTRVSHSSVVCWKWLPMFGVKVLEVVVNGPLETLFEFFRVPFNVFHSISLPSVSTLKFFFPDDTSKPYMESSFESFFLQPKLPFPHLKPDSYGMYNGHSMWDRDEGRDCGRKKHHIMLCRRRRRVGTAMLFYRPLVWPFIKLINNPLYFLRPPQEAYMKHYNKLYLQQQQQQLHMQYYNNNNNNGDLAFQQHMPYSAYNSHFNNNNFRIPLQHPDQHHNNKIENIYNIFGNNNNNRPPSPTPVVSGFTGKNIKLFTYQPPNSKGGIGISNEDLFCLNDGEYLNDVIIDFYLKYLMEEIVSTEDKDATHIFSSFFYSHLVSNNNNHSSNLNAEEQRHTKVKRWTRNVDIFSKDFIIVPINESYHWFLAIICFPNERNKKTKTKADKLPAATTAATTTTADAITAETTSATTAVDNFPAATTTVDTMTTATTMTSADTIARAVAGTSCDVMISSSVTSTPPNICSVAEEPLNNVAMATVAMDTTSPVTMETPGIDVAKIICDVLSSSSRDVISLPSSSASSLITFSASITPSSLSSTDVTLLKSEEDNKKNYDNDFGEDNVKVIFGGDVVVFGGDKDDDKDDDDKKDSVKSKGDVTNVDKDHSYKKNSLAVVTNGDGGGGEIENGESDKIADEETDRDDDRDDDKEENKVNINENNGDFKSNDNNVVKEDSEGDKGVDNDDDDVLNDDSDGDKGVDNDDDDFSKGNSEVVCEDVYADCRLGDVAGDDKGDNDDDEGDNDDSKVDNSDGKSDNDDGKSDTGDGKVDIDDDKGDKTNDKDDKTDDKDDQTKSGKNDVLNEDVSEVNESVVLVSKDDKDGDKNDVVTCEGGSKVSEDDDKKSEDDDKVSEGDDKVSEDDDKVSEGDDKMSVDDDKKSEDNDEVSQGDDKIGGGDMTEVAMSDNAMKDKEIKPNSDVIKNDQLIDIAINDNNNALPCKGNVIVERDSEVILKSDDNGDDDEGGDVAKVCGLSDGEVKIVCDVSKGGGDMVDGMVEKMEEGCEKNDGGENKNRDDEGEDGDGENTKGDGEGKDGDGESSNGGGINDKKDDIVSDDNVDGGMDTSCPIGDDCKSDHDIKADDGDKTDNNDKSDNEEDGMDVDASNGLAEELSTTADVTMTSTTADEDEAVTTTTTPDVTISSKDDSPIATTTSDDVTIATTTSDDSHIATTTSDDVTIATTTTAYSILETNKTADSIIEKITTAADVTMATMATSDCIMATKTTADSNIATTTNAAIATVTAVDLTASPAKHQQRHTSQAAESEDSDYVDEEDIQLNASTTTTPTTSTATTTNTTPTTTPTIPTTTTTATDNNPKPETYEEATASRNPCILIFDSLKGENRFDVVNILRQYLQVEWNTRKRDTEGDRSFDRMNMKGAMVNCPQQLNTTDCGIYMLQFVKSFFRDKVDDFTLPVQLEDWFKTQEVMSKRVKLARLIMSLKAKLNPDLVYNPHDDGCFNMASLSDDDDAYDDDDDEEDEEELSSVGDYDNDEDVIKGGKYGVSDDDGMSRDKDDEDDDDDLEVIKDIGSFTRVKVNSGGDDDEYDEMDLDSENEENDNSNDNDEAKKICLDLINLIIDAIDTGGDSKNDDDDDDIDIDGENDNTKCDDVNYDNDNKVDNVNNSNNNKDDVDNKSNSNNKNDDTTDNNNDNENDDNKDKGKDEDEKSCISPDEEMSEKVCKNKLEEGQKVNLSNDKKDVIDKDVDESRNTIDN